jgi:outer membrane protein assembly factor BamA/autotransporter translocation and assembly factor TamB
VSGQLEYDGTRLRLVQIHVRSPHHDLTARGTIGLLGPAPTWDVGFQSASDVGLVLASWSDLPAARGRARVTGRVMGPLGAPQVEALATADRLTLGSLDASALELRAAMSGQAGVVIDRVSFGAFGGRVEGRLAMPGEGRADTVEITGRGVDLASLLRAAGLAAEVAARADLIASLEGDVGNPRTWALRATATLMPRPGEGAPVAGRATVSQRDGAWTLALRDGRLDALALTADARGRWLAAPASQQASSLAGSISLESPDLAAALHSLGALGLEVPPAVRSRVGGSLAATLTLGGALAAPDVTFPLADHHVAIAGIGDVTLGGVARLTKGRTVVLDGVSAAAGSRTATLSGSIDLTRGQLALDVDARGFLASDLPALGVDPVWLPGAGVLAARGRISGRVDHPDVEATVDARALEWLGQRLDAVAGRVSLRGSTIGFESVSATSGEGRLSIDGFLDPTRETFDVKVGATGVTLAPIALPAADGRTRLVDVAGILDLAFQGRGTLARPVGSGRASLRNARYGEVLPGEVAATVEMTGDGHALVTAAIPSLSATLTGSVGTQWPSPFETTVSVRGLSVAQLAATGIARAIAGDVAATASGTVVATGRLDDLEATVLDVSLESAEGRACGVPVRLSRPARIHIAADEISTEEVAFVSGQTSIVAGGRLTGADDGALRVTADGQLGDLVPIAARLAGRAAIADGSFKGVLAATGPARAPRLAGGLTVAGGRVQLDGWPAVDAIALDVALADGQVALRRFSARLDEASVEVSGVAPLGFFGAGLPQRVLRANPAQGQASLSAAADDLSLATLGKLAGSIPGADLNGRGDVRAELTAPRADLASLTGTVVVERATLAVGDLAINQVGAAEVRVANGTARFDEWRWSGAGTDLALVGDLDFLRRPVAYAIEARGPADLSLVGTVLPGRTAGHLRADVRASRGHGEDGITGELVLERASWVDRGLNVALSDLSGTVRLRRDRVLFDGLAGRFNGGDVAITGAMVREPDATLGGALGIVARNVTVEYPASVVNDLDADLQFSSPGPRDARYGLTGTVQVRPGVLSASLRELALMFLPGPQALPTPETERRQRLFANVGLDIEVRTADDLVADSNELRAQLGAQVRLTGTLATPGVLGRADIRDEGELFLAGRLYELQGGRIDFVDANRIDPRLSLVALTRISTYEVQMQLTGPIDNVQFRLRSDPPLSQADLASLITTGQTLKERREQAGSGASDAAGAQVLSAVSSETLGRIGRMFGVDTVRIESSTRNLSAVDLDPVARLSVTKELGDYFEVVYSQSLEENDDLAWILTYKSGWRDLELKGTFTTNQGETYELRQEFRFGGGAKGPTRRRPSRPHAPEVSGVTVDGATPAEAAEILGELSVRQGRKFDVYKWRRDKDRVERYYRERNRLRTTVSAGRRPSADGATIALDYELDRGPVATLRTVGHTFDRTAIERLRTAWAESPIDDFADDDLAGAARLLLASEGYVRPEVSVEVRVLGEDRQEAILTVVPGPRAGSRTVAFAGNNAFTSHRLAALVTEAGLGDRPWAEPESVAAPIASYYAAAGFLNVRVSPGVPRVEGTTAVLPVTVSEGRQFVVSKIEVTGAKQVSETEVRRTFGLGDGGVYTPAAAEAGANAVRRLYTTSGHSEAVVRVETRFNRDRSSARVQLSIDEGLRRVVSGADVSGAIGTSPRLTARALQLATGGPLNTEKVDEVQRKLYDLGVFRSVEPRFEPVGEPAKAADGSVTQPVRVVFDLEEYARYRLRYGLQLTTDQLVSNSFVNPGTKPGVTLDLRRSNLFGYGFDVGAGVFWTKDRKRFRALSQSATWFGRPLQTTVTLTRDDERGSSAFDGGNLTVSQSETLLSAEQRWRPTRRTEHAYGYNLEYQDLSLDIVPLPFRGEPLLLELSARLGSATTTFTYDSRDNLLNPRRGMFHSANLEIGLPWLASELQYAKYLGQHFFFIPAGRVTVASAARFGSVGILDEQEQRLESILVRYRTGGGTTVRGYEQDELTPFIVPGIPRGGDVLLVLNQELRVAFGRWLGAVVFADAGNAFATWQDASLGGLEVGLGAGLRLITPVGVIRLDAGYPQSKPASDRKVRWYFSFGHAF